MNEYKPFKTVLHHYYKRMICFFKGHDVNPEWFREAPTKPYTVCKRCGNRVGRGYHMYKLDGYP